MTLVNLQQIKSNRTKLIDFISDDDCTVIVRFDNIILGMQPNNIGSS